jgi:multisubunit Na+/H+ antiporter MnhE subunit
MKDNFWSLIWSSFLDIQGILIGFLGVVITIVLSRFQVKTNIPLDLAIVILFFILLLIVTLFKAASKSFSEYQKAKAEFEKLTIRNSEL